MNTRLAKRINQMAEADQKMRNDHKKGAKFDTALDMRHTEELKAIIKEYGWPTISLVGKKASRNAWLLAQHADHSQKFQETVLRLFRRIDRESHDVDRANIAYLADRLSVNKKRTQRFGTQFYFDKKGCLVLHPLMEPNKIDRLRKEYNLPPLAEFLKMADDFNSQRKSGER
jgi:primosomal protein N''